MAAISVSCSLCMKLKAVDDNCESRLSSVKAMLLRQYEEVHNVTAVSVSCSIHMMHKRL